MRMNNIKMTTRVKRSDLLVTLRTNLDKHAKIVQEARDGYIKQAQEALRKRLEELRTGMVVSLSFHLRPPADYSEVYRNTIAMLEMNLDDSIVLEADEFRQLVRDEWDWSQQFLASNSGYSGTAKMLFDSVPRND